MAVLITEGLTTEPALMFMLFCIVQSTYNMFLFAMSPLWSLELASDFFHDFSLIIFVDKSRGYRDSGMH